MTSNKPPKWGWEGVYECPDCGEPFDFFKEEGYEQAPFSEQWVVQVFHHHGNADYPEGRWQVALYQKWKGRQRPKIVKDAEAQKSEAYKRDQTAKQIRNAETS